MTVQNPFGGNPFDPSPAGHPHPGPIPAGIPAARQDEVNILATLSVVFAFVFAPAGAILGHLGLSQIARTRQRGRDRALVGVTLSYVFVTAAVVALVVWAALGHNDTHVQTAAPPSTTAAPSTTTTTTPPPPPTVAPADLAGLLPAVEDVKRFTGNLKLQLTQTDDHITPDTETLDNENCYSTFLTATSHGYDVSALTGFASTDIRDQTNPLHNPAGTSQAVTAFHDADAAQQQARTLTDSWRRCADTSFVDTEASGTKRTYAAGQPITEANAITTIEYRQTVPATSGPPLRIVRMLAVKDNVVIDIMAGSRLGGSSQHDVALAIVNFILDRIRGPR